MSADLAVLTADPASLDLYDDPGKQIVLACERANAWLKAGNEVRIETIVETKAQAAALAEFAIQKQLGKDAELAALEVQRRAERGVGLAIRAGQAAGEIRSSGSDTRTDLVDRDNLVPVASPYEFVSKSEMHSTHGGISDLTDGVSDDEFEDAIEDAKADGNLSRANVIRKVKGEPAQRLSGEKRLDVIRERAGGGRTSFQIADEIGHNPEYIRQLARENDIEIPADRLMSRGAGNRRLDSNRIAREAVLAMDGVATTLRLINYDDLDVAEATEWATSLTDSIRALNRFAKQIKEMTQ
jgi:hypothetical protein